MKFIGVLFLSLMVCSSVAQASDCHQYFFNSSEQALSLSSQKTSNSALSTSPKTPQDLERYIQTKIANTLNVIQPHLNSRSENAYWIMQYVDHNVADSISAVNQLTHSNGLLNLSDTASGLLSSRNHQLKTSLEHLSNAQIKTGFFSRWSGPSKKELFAYANEALAAKEDILALKEKSSQEALSLAEKLQTVRWAQHILKAEIYYVDTILNSISRPTSVADLPELTISLVNKLTNMRAQQVLLEALITNYEHILNLSRSEIQNAELLFDITYPSVYTRHTDIFDQAIKNNETQKQALINQRDNPKIDKRLLTLIEYFDTDSRINQFLEYIEHSNLTISEAFFILKHIPRGSAWAWENASGREALHALHHMRSLGLGNFRASEREYVDYHLLIGILTSIRGKVSIEEKKELKHLVMRIFERSNMYNQINLRYKTQYIRLVDHIIYDL